MTEIPNQVQTTISERYRQRLGPVKRFREVTSDEPIEPVGVSFPIKADTPGYDDRPRLGEIAETVATRTSQAIFIGRQPERDNHGILTDSRVQTVNQDDPVEPMDRDLIDEIVEAWLRIPNPSDEGPILVVEKRGHLNRMQRTTDGRTRQQYLEDALGGFDIVNLPTLDSNELFIVDPDSVVVETSHEGGLEEPEIRPDESEPFDRKAEAITAARGRLRSGNGVARVQLVTA